MIQLFVSNIVCHYLSLSWHTFLFSVAGELDLIQLFASRNLLPLTTISFSFIGSDLFSL